MAKNLDPGLGKRAGLLTLRVEQQRFNKFIDSFIKQSSLSSRVIIRKMALDLLKRIVVKNPVATGRSRAGWFVSMTELGGGWSDKGSSTKAIAKGKSEGKFINRLNGALKQYVVLINGVYYSVYLEHGTSGQAPAGMVRVSIREMIGPFPKAIAASYKLIWDKQTKIYGKVN